jgi:ribosomal protein S18 acetylase RimI-like enzyme
LGSCEVVRADGRLLRAVRVAALADAAEMFGMTPAMVAAELSALDVGDGWGKKAAELAWFVALGRNKEVLGCAAVAVAIPRPADRGTFWRVHSVWTSPQMRNHGVGTRLMRAVADHALIAGATHLRLWVVEDNHLALEFYRRHGFVRTGGREPRSVDNPTCFIVELHAPIVTA